MAKKYNDRITFYRQDYDVITDPHVHAEGSQLLSDDNQWATILDEDGPAQGYTWKRGNGSPEEDDDMSYIVDTDEEGYGENASLIGIEGSNIKEKAEKGDWVERKAFDIKLRQALTILVVVLGAVFVYLGYSEYTRRSDLGRDVSRYERQIEENNRPETRQPPEPTATPLPIDDEDNAAIQSE